MLNHPKIVSKNEAGQRLDVWLVQKFGNSRNYWQGLIKLGNVQLNHKLVKASYQVEANDNITITKSEETCLEPQAAPAIEIVYEDDELLVVEKPAGLLVHAVKGQQPQATLAQFAAARTSDPDPDRPGIVHRLDRDTSGLIIIAKTATAKAFLQEQFRSRQVHKTYQLLVEGHLRQPEALIDLPIGRKSDSAKRTVMPTGREAQTKYKVLLEFPKYSLVEAYPQTGRTHQLRVHFNHLGHPIVGDNLYGHKPPVGLKRLFLHATSLEFTTPSGLQLKLRSTLPPQLQQFLLSLTNAV